MMRRLLIALTLAAVVVPAPASLAGERQRRSDERETQTERITRSVNIGPSGELDLSNVAGDIVITRAGGTTLLIEAVKTARGATAEEAREMLALVPVESTERGTRVEARTRYPSGD